MSDEIRELDVPDDVRRWDDATRYRVTYWEKLHDGGMTPNGERSVPMWSESPRQIVGARDVEAVLEWAQAHANGRLFEIFAESDLPPARCVRVYGVEPTAPDEAEEADRRYASRIAPA